jgi:hypothetical protein
MHVPSDSWLRFVLIILSILICSTRFGTHLNRGTNPDFPTCATPRRD